MAGKTTLPTAPRGSGLGTLLWLLIIAAVVMFVVQTPGEAATAVRTAASWFMTGVEALTEFLRLTFEG